MTTLARLLRISLLVVLVTFLFAAYATMGQTETGTVSGLISDETGGAVPGAEVQLLNVQRGTTTDAKTNGAGIYVFAGVEAGMYQIKVQKAGFKQVDLLSLIVNVQDHIEENVRLQVGSVSESVTVNADDIHINTTDASVSTVVDRQFAENLPMNGRSFQTLIDLTPGVVLTAGNGGTDTGQFSVNGQRGSSNYWMVDGVSANLGTSTLFGGNGTAGAVGTTSVLGGTNSLVSVDALQEFRIQTSTFAPEFGRTPGAQISIVTRSGGNQFHGSLFDYLRNDIFDAGDWFNGTTNPPLPKAKERQNDFGGTFGGPILKNRTFFFFSYEGLRLRLPTTTLTGTPDLNARQNASSAMKPFLNAFPFDSKQPELGNGVAQFNASYSIPATLDDYSVRVDHKLSEKLNVFARYNYSPSEILQRGPFGTSLNTVLDSRITAQQATIGSTWMISPHWGNELRLNYSRADASGRTFLDSFGGASPLTSLPFPAPYTAQNARLFFNIFSVVGASFFVGPVVSNLQRQVNLVDNLSLQQGTHNLKFGVDYRRLSPRETPFVYQQLAFFRDVPSAASGNLFESIVGTEVGVTLLLRNVSAFAQDTWRIVPRLTITYGIRWDTDFAPSSTTGPNIAAVTGFNLADLSRLALAPAGQPPFKTVYGNFAPRVGMAYQLSEHQDWGTVARGGFGVFYDLATSDVGNLINESGYPFFTPNVATIGGTFPLSPTAAAPPPIEPPNAANRGTLTAFDPGLQLPYSLQWNFALEQGLGRQQTLSATYIGSTGRRLLQTSQVTAPNPNIARANLFINAGSADYNGLQLQFQRRLSQGLQALASYTWSHSIDTASAGSAGTGSNLLASAAGPQLNRGPSDFDIRNAFSAGVTYAIPVPKLHPFVNAITRGWSLQTTIQVRSAPPVEILDGNFGRLPGGFLTDIRPDVTRGVALYLYGPQFPGGKAINGIVGAVAGGCSDGSQSVGPFCPPPVDANGNPTRQGTLGRNALRGFGATQWDFAVHRDFPIHDSLALQFRAEMFNILNHPNFGAPLGDISSQPFGVPTQMLGQSLSGGGLGTGSFNPLYQIGGPRSMQFALKVAF